MECINPVKIFKILCTYLYKLKDHGRAISVNVLIILYFIDSISIPHTVKLSRYIDPTEKIWLLLALGGPLRDKFWFISITQTRMLNMTFVFSERTKMPPKPMTDNLLSYKILMFVQQKNPSCMFSTFYDIQI